MTIREIREKAYKLFLESGDSTALGAALQHQIDELKAECADLEFRRNVVYYRE